MVVTSVSVATEGGGAKIVTGKPRGANAKRIGDSKALVAFDDSSLGEAWARAIVKRTMGLEPSSPDALLGLIALDTPEILRAPCPSHHQGLCWNAEGERFGADDDMVAACLGDLERLEKRGVRVVRARTAIICTKQLNAGVERGLSRFDLDLHAMERLTLAANEDTGAEVYALCGKVGGLGFYPARFGPLAGRLHVTIVEGRAKSEYQVPGVGRLAFVRDADENHLIVGLASIVGKWVRDHLMRRVVRFHRDHIPDLPDASGYHDPVTTEFIRASALVRKKLKVAAECFERRSIGGPSGPISSEPKKPKATAAPKSQSQLGLLRPRSLGEA